MKMKVLDTSPVLWLDDYEGEKVGGRIFSTLWQSAIITW
jgi:hypothetical protein